MCVLALLEGLLQSVCERVSWPRATPGQEMALEGSLEGRRGVALSGELAHFNFFVNIHLWRFKTFYQFF